MAEAFIPKPGTVNLFASDNPIEGHSKFKGVLITTENIEPNTAYNVYADTRIASNGKEFVKFSLGTKFVPKAQQTQESAKGADVEDDLGDVPF